MFEAFFIFNIILVISLFVVLSKSDNKKLQIGIGIATSICIMFLIHWGNQPLIKPTMTVAEEKEVEEYVEKYHEDYRFKGNVKIPSDYITEKNNIEKILTLEDIANILEGHVNNDHSEIETTPQNIFDTWISTNGYSIIYLGNNLYSFADFNESNDSYIDVQFNEDETVIESIEFYKQ